MGTRLAFVSKWHGTPGLAWCCEASLALWLRSTMLELGTYKPTPTSVRVTLLHLNPC